MLSRISYIENLSNWEDEFSFYSSVNVRFSETDLFGHLNNTVVFIYFEQARVEFFKELGFMEEWSHPTGESMIVTADLQCDFLHQVYFDEYLKIYTKISEIGNSSLDLHYMAKNDNDVICFVGRGRMVQVSKESGKAVPWSTEWKARMEDYRRTKRG